MADELNLEIGIPVTLATPDHFLLCKESLTRIGVANIRDKLLYASCNILHKKGRYYICHFKSLFILDGKPSTITDDDIKRRNLICKLLEDWGLLKIEDRSILSNTAPLNSVKIISFSDKKNWELVSKYSLGNRR